MARIKPYRSLFHAVRPRSYSPRPMDYRLVRAIRGRATELFHTSDDRLKELVDQQRRRIHAGESWQSSSVVQEVSALVYEAVRRRLAMCFYDVQLLAGIALSTGVIAEMKTGEGKTVVSALPAVIAALSGEGVHVATVNSYLAGRDFETLRPVYELLGLTVGLLREGDSTEKKRAAYRADITYGTGYEFGFDYLRDQLTQQKEITKPLGDGFRRNVCGYKVASGQTVQRGLYFAIVDEVDSVLIDEASTPLVIGGPSATFSSDPAAYKAAHAMAKTLVAERHYLLDHRQQTVQLTDKGMSRIFRDVPERLARPWSLYVEQALRARCLMQCNVDYVIQDGLVKIVDPHTGRIFDERTWRDGLHQAVEAKEGVSITVENRTLARISRQRFFQLYRSLCGMSGTAVGHEQEFDQFYGLSVVEIPLHKPCLRKYAKPRFFATQENKLAATAQRILELHRMRRPVLVGTRTIASSLLLSKRLRLQGVPHHVLNGVQDEEEAAIIAGAGIAGAVTIATNMAGRGTDIRLDHASRSLGGLHVLSLEFHDSSRVDRQLEGRAARQGDIGFAEFYASAEDALFQHHAPKLAEAIMQSAAGAGEATRCFLREVRKLQSKVERGAFAARRKVYRQQRWLDKVLSAIAEPAVPQPTSSAKQGEAA